MSLTYISAINLKGGASKSSTILNLGGVLSENGKKPILIDLDPQLSVTRWANQGGDKFPFPVISMKIGKDPKKFKNQLDQLIQRHKADYILFDTPPQLEQEALVCALLSDLVLIPITPSPLDLWAGEQAIQTVKEARKERKGILPKIALIPSRVVPNTILAREIAGSLKQFNEPVAPAISLRVAMAESVVSGLPVNLYAPNSPSHKEFKDLLKFVINNLRK